MILIFVPFDSFSHFCLFPLSRLRFWVARRVLVKMPVGSAFLPPSSYIHTPLHDSPPVLRFPGESPRASLPSIPCPPLEVLHIRRLQPCSVPFLLLSRISRAPLFYTCIQFFSSRGRGGGRWRWKRMWEEERDERVQCCRGVEVQGETWLGRFFFTGFFSIRLWNYDSCNERTLFFWQL